MQLVSSETVQITIGKCAVCKGLIDSGCGLTYKGIDVP